MHSQGEWTEFLTDLEHAESLRADLTRKARETARGIFGNQIFVRGLIEFTSYCRKDCYYCGLRCSNREAERYRLTREEILDCCREGYGLGLRTFVLQGGEDPGADRALCKLIGDIKNLFPDCALTLSVGERDRETYRTWRRAGADRYLLRHETADPAHYAVLHPPGLTAENRRRCLWDLKELGYQVGAGFMVGTPGQGAKELAQDFLFLEELQPDMVGIGPFVPHHRTPFADHPAGSTELTVTCLSLLRVTLPEVLLPATTALATLDPRGRQRAILAGANVVMPNLSPLRVRGQYDIYDNKCASGSEAAEGLRLLAGQMKDIGYEIAVDRGDAPRMRRKEDHV